MTSHKKVFSKTKWLLRLSFLGTFKWAETHQAVEYTNWWPNEPDNGNGGSDEDCVHKSVNVAVGIGWNDIACDATQIFDIAGIYALCMRKYNPHP